MKVLLFSDVQRKGGAGIAAHRLAGALIGQGHEVRWATPYPDNISNIPTINCQNLALAGRTARKIALALQPGQRQAVDSRAITQQLLREVRVYRPDVLNIHNLHGANLPATLPAELSHSVPVVWTLHDMWAFTGTCAYAMDCRKFETACDSTCPLAGNYPASPADQIPRLYEQRRQSLQDADRLAFATPSAWLAGEARRGMLNGFDIRTIPNSVDLDVFRPIDRSAARQALDLPLGRPVLVTAATPDDPRKGASILHDALIQLARPNTILLQLGGTMPRGIDGRWDHRVLAGVHDPRLLRLAYSAADAHILPTLADNLPNTLLEAAACGVPSIGSDVGGVGEAMQVGGTGWLFTPGDSEGLAERMGQLIDESKDELHDRRGACRMFAESNYAPVTQARRYTEFYNATINTGDLRQTDSGNVRHAGKEAA